MNDLYTVIAIDGEFSDFMEDITMPYLRYEALTWDDAVELCRLSFKNRFQCVLWRQEDESAGGTDHATTESGAKL